MASSVSEPLPRYCHHSAAVGGKIFIYGGHTKDFSKEKRELSVSVHSFNQCLETWQTRATTGKHPPGLYAGACTSSGHHLYLYGGLDGSRRHNALYQLDTNTLEWSQLPSGPMRKTGCSMVSYKDKLILFGGYGTSSSPTQPGAEFVVNTSTTSTGWTNELHMFDITGGKWSSPTVTGTRPPPCRDFSLTMIDQEHAVLFGGHMPTRGTSNDMYILDLHKMHWTLLDNVQPWPWPGKRDRHAATCLWNDMDEPQLLVTGGRDEDGKVLKDIWLLDFQAGRWREIIIPRLKARCTQCATAFKVFPGVMEVTLFGGCPKWPKSAKNATDIPQIAKTTVLRFEFWENPHSDGLSTGEWVLIDMAEGSQLGTRQRIEEKTEKMIQATSTSIPRCEAERRLQEAEERRREAEMRLKEAMEEKVQAAEERAREAEIGWMKAEDKTREAEIGQIKAEDMARESEGKSRKAEDRASEAEDRAREAEDMAKKAEEKTKEAEDKAREAEDKMREAKREQTKAEDEAREAEARCKEAEARWKEAENKATRANERAMEAERRQREADNKANHAEKKWKEAEIQAAEVERRWRVAEDRAIEAGRRQIEAERRQRVAEGRTIKSERGRRQATNWATNLERRLTTAENRALLDHATEVGEAKLYWPGNPTSEAKDTKKGCAHQASLIMR